jgi:hypothetical protein
MSKLKEVLRVLKDFAGVAYLLSTFKPVKDDVADSIGLLFQHTAAKQRVK